MTNHRTAVERMFVGEKWRMAIDVMDVLLTRGFQAYIVGGAVRDEFLKRDVSDIDIATNALPDTVLRLFPRAIPTAPQHGTVTIVTTSGRCEVTTFRTDGAYGDGRRPDDVQFGDDLLEDLARRDFTMNAMALSKSGECIDPFAGQSDLQNQILRTVGPPADRFAEDALRMLRAFRFAATYDLSIEARTYDGIVQNAQGIVHVSSERIGIELSKLSFGHWPLVLEPLHNSNLFRFCGEPLSWLQDGFESLLKRTLDKSISCTKARVPHGVAAIAAWFTLVEDGSSKVEKICRETALGKKTGRQCKKMVHLASKLLIQDGESGFCLAPQELFACGLENANHVIDISSWLCPEHAADFKQQHQLAILAQPIWSLQELSVDGRDMFHLGARKSEIGQLLETLLQRVLNGSVENRRTILLHTAKNILDNGG